LNFTLSNELHKIKTTFASPLNAPFKSGLLNPGHDLNTSAVNFVMPPIFGEDDNSPLPSPAPEKKVPNA